MQDSYQPVHAYANDVSKFSQGILIMYCITFQASGGSVPEVVATNN